MQVLFSSILTLGAAAAQLDSVKSYTFGDYMAKFGKSYKTEAEFEKRMTVWRQKKSYIDR
jgi:hypothetical protein